MVADCLRIEYTTTGFVTTGFNCIGNASIPCNGHGSCVGQDNCQCDVGWAGPECMDQELQSSPQADNRTMYIAIGAGAGTF